MSSNQELHWLVIIFFLLVTLMCELGVILSGEIRCLLLRLKIQRAYSQAKPKSNYFTELGECCKVITINKKTKDAIRLTSDNNESFISNCAS